jgi:tetratricopeptide (TPR) repeat protein
VLVAFAVRSHVRTMDWQNNRTLWEATVAIAPDSVRGQYNLGVALLVEGDLLASRAALERATALAPSDRDALLMLANVNGRLGEIQRAYELAARAVELQRDERALAVLGWAQLSRGQAEAAIALFEEAIARGGDTADARRGLARARAGAGRF